MDPLSDKARAEIDEALVVMVRSMEQLGVRCVAVVDGRGLSRAVYSKESAPHVPTLLASAYNSATKFNAKQVN